MRSWNGWGDDGIHVSLAPNALSLLRDRIGEAHRKHKDVPLEDVLSGVPVSRLPDHRRIFKAPQHRLSHAHGQSMPDWIRLRWGTLKRFPDGVAFPTSTEELSDILRFAQEMGAVVIPFGGGTSVVGHLSVPADPRPVLSISLSRLNRLLSLNETSRLATFEAGAAGPDVEAQLRAHGFTLGHYPQSFEYSTLGGWVVTRSSGQQSAHYGRIEDLFAGGEVSTPRGPLICPPYPASAAGPDLRQLILGSEGRLGILHKAILKIRPLPEKDDVYAVFFPSWNHAVEAVRSVAGEDIPFSMMRLSNPEETLTQLALAGKETAINVLKRYLKLRKITDGVMCLIGFTGSRSHVAGAKRRARIFIRRHKGVSVGRPIGEAWKKNRFRAPYLRNTLWSLGYAVDTVETAVSWDRVTVTMMSLEKAVRESLNPMNENVHVFSHLSHVYATGSSIYTTFLFRLADTAEETLSRWQDIKTAASRAIVAAGGTISHQHGVGTDHREFLKAEKGAVGMEILRELIEYVDPDRRFNPGKLVRRVPDGS